MLNSLFLKFEILLQKSELNLKCTYVLEFDWPQLILAVYSPSQYSMFKPPKTVPD